MASVACDVLWTWYQPAENAHRCEVLNSSQLRTQNVVLLAGSLLKEYCMVNPPERRGIMTDVWSRYRIGKLRILSGHCRIHREAPGTMYFQYFIDYSLFRNTLVMFSCN